MKYISLKNNFKIMKCAISNCLYIYYIYIINILYIVIYIVYEIRITWYEIRMTYTNI